MSGVLRGRTYWLCSGSFVAAASMTLATQAQAEVAVTSGAAAAQSTVDPQSGQLITANEAPLADPVSGQGTTGAAEAGEIVVTGIRQSLRKSVDLKREAITLRDSIVAEDIGKFPEQNIADALVRIPGVELVKDGNSNEGQTIRLRGLGAEYTMTTFNGSAVYTTSSGGVGNASRTFNYDLFPSELFGRVDVYKAPLAELTEGGIAGVVDLQTARPFDYKGRQIRYNIAANHNSQTGFISPRAHLLFSDRFFNDRVGFLVSVAGAKSKNGRSGFESTGTYSGSSDGPLNGAPLGSNFRYNFNAPNINLNGFTPDEIRSALLPRFFIVGAANNLRKRLGVSTSLQYRDDRFSVSLDGLYSTLSDGNEKKDIRWPIRDSINALSLVPINVSIDDNNNLQGTLGNVQFNYASFFDRSKTKYKYLSLNPSYEISDTLRLAGQLAMSNSNAWRNNTTLSGDARQFRHEITFDTSDPVFPVITTNRDLLDRATYFTNTGPSYSGGYRTEIDKLKSGRAFLDWEYGLMGIRGRMKTGFSMNNNEKTLRTRSTNNVYNTLTIPGVGPYATATVAQRNAFITSFLAEVNVSDFVPGARSSLPDEFLSFPSTFVYDFLDVLSANQDAPLALGTTYTAVERIKAAFLQSDFDTDVFGKRLRWNLGIRHVWTAADIDNNQLNPAIGAFEPRNRKYKYNDWLPSATFAFDLTKDLVLRGAWGKTLTRSAIQLIASSISLPSGGAGNLFLNAGNPELQPERSRSLDGSIEWYFAKGSVLSLAAYKKTISGRQTFSTTFVPFNELGVSPSFFTPNIQLEIAANPAILTEVRRPINLGTYGLKGIELAYQQQFDFLPAPFDGFGAQASFTRVKTEALTRAFNGNTYPLVAVPRTTYAISSYYEKGPVALRVSYNRKSEVSNINSTNGNVIGFQRWANPRGYLDASASYKVSKALELRVDGSNLTNTRTYDFFRHFEGRYGDEESRVEGAYQNGRVITLGIRGAL